MVNQPNVLVVRFLKEIATFLGSTYIARQFVLFFLEPSIVVDAHIGIIDPNAVHGPVPFSCCICSVSLWYERLPNSKQLLESNWGKGQ